MLVREEEKIKRMEVGDNVESNYHPLVVWLKEGRRETRKGGRRNKINRGEGV